MNTEVNIVSKDVTYKELDASLTDPIETIAKNYEKWCYECIKSVSGNDLTDKSERELREFFGNDKPILLATNWADVVSLVYKNNVFIKRRSELESV